MPRPWERTQTGPTTDHRILRIRQDRAINPRNGREQGICLVESPDWVNLIPVTRDGQVVLVRQFRFGIWSSTLEIPGGMVEPHESPEQAGVRELLEETGYRPARVVPLGSVHPNPAFQTNRCHHFLGLDCEQVSAPRPEEGEDVEVELRPRSEIPALFRSGEITHALVASAFFFAGLHER